MIWLIAGAIVLVWVLLGIVWLLRDTGEPNHSDLYDQDHDFVPLYPDEPDPWLTPPDSQTLIEAQNEFEPKQKERRKFLHPNRKHGRPRGR